MREKTRRQPDRWLPFLRLSDACPPPIEYAMLEVYPAAVRARLQSGPTNRARTSSGVERNQDKAGDMPRCGPGSRRAFIILPKSPSCPKKVRRLAPSSTTLLEGVTEAEARQALERCNSHFPNNTESRHEDPPIHDAPPPISFARHTPYMRAYLCRADFHCQRIPTTCRAGPLSPWGAHGSAQHRLHRQK